MANTYSQIYLQFVFAVKFRDSLISYDWEELLYKYITGIVQGNGQKMIAINGMPDHIHLFIGMKPDCRPSDLVREVKKSSTAFIKSKRLCQSVFSWQEGYGAFSYSHSHLSKVADYIANQKQHHQRTGFKTEYLNMLKKFEIEFKDEYIFEFLFD
jgi:REP element-mobilizing transposase RayT